MELKDVILSTLAEMENSELSKKASNRTENFEIKEKHTSFIKEVAIQELVEEVQSLTHESEMVFLVSIRERLLVLFEGFQAPNNANIEAKVDLILNFLEYILGTVDSRIEMLEKGNKK